MLTKQNFFWFDAGLEHKAARSRGNGVSFDWLSHSRDIGACDTSPERNPEKYGSPIKLSYWHVRNALIVTYDTS